MANHQSSDKGAFNYDIAAIAASVGGLNAISVLLAGLPDTLPVPLLVVQHLDRRNKSMMADILSRRTSLHVKQAEHGEKVIVGTVYIAPPDSHLTIDKDAVIVLTGAEPVHFVRPSADVLFESVAKSYGDKAIAVVLTGSGFDGADGVRKIKGAGGFVIAQDEASSQFFSMPDTAIKTGCVDCILPLDDIAAKIAELVGAGNLNDRD